MPPHLRLRSVYPILDLEVGDPQRGLPAVTQGKGVGQGIAEGALRCRPPSPGNSGGFGRPKPPPSSRFFASECLIQIPFGNANRTLRGYARRVSARKRLKCCVSSNSKTVEAARAS